MGISCLLVISDDKSDSSSRSSSRSGGGLEKEGALVGGLAAKKNWPAKRLAALTSQLGAVIWFASLNCLAPSCFSALLVWLLFGRDDDSVAAAVSHYYSLLSLVLVVMSVHSSCRLGAHEPGAQAAGLVNLTRVQRDQKKSTGYIYIKCIVVYPQTDVMTLHRRAVHLVCRAMCCRCCCGCLISLLCRRRRRPLLLLINW